MTEAGLLHRSADVRWAGTVVWTTERGARVAGVGLGAPHPPGERLLHRLALADVGLRQEAKGRIVLTEREVRTAEAVPGRAAELLADLGVPGVHEGAPLLAVPAGPARCTGRTWSWCCPERASAPSKWSSPRRPRARSGGSCGRTDKRAAGWCTWAPSRSSANCRAAPARTGGGSTASPRTSGCCYRTEAGGLLNVRRFIADDPAFDRWDARHAQRR